jgi:NADPH:quinone reductase-like Zn-dependent oxidoreductase
LVDIKPGETLLVSGASGAVGGFAVQLAAAEGAHVIGIAAAGDEDYVTTLGAKDVITRVDDLVGAVRTLVPQGVAAALDAATVGPSLLGAVRDSGTFIAVTDPATPVAERGIRVDKVSVVPDSAALSELVRLLDRGDLTVRLAEVLPLADAAEAHRRAAAGVRGKLVLSG